MDRYRFFKPFGYACIAISCGCASTETYWQYHEISTGQNEFDSAKICYASRDALGGMNLEFFQSNGKITGYLNSVARCFKTEGQLSAQIQYSSASEPIFLNVHEGRMRASLSQESTEKIVQLLQDGQSITIIVDSQSQDVAPGQFNLLFHQLTKGQ